MSLPSEDGRFFRRPWPESVVTSGQRCGHGVHQLRTDPDLSKQLLSANLLPVSTQLGTLLYVLGGRRHGPAPGFRQQWADSPYLPHLAQKNPKNAQTQLDPGSPDLQSELETKSHSSSAPVGGKLCS
jgi:hypothetical protein